MVETRYYSAKLHLHSCFESKASMRGHCFRAKRLGVDIVWITDHDRRICWRRNKAFWEDNFERKHLANHLDAKGRFDGWRVIALDEGITGGAELMSGISLSGKQSMRIWARSTHTRREWGSLQIKFSTKGKKHQRSLMMGVSISLAIRPEQDFGENGRLRICVELSQQPPSFDVENLTYVIGGNDEKDKTISLGDLKRSEWNILRLDLTNDALEYTKGGVDNVFGGLSLLVDSRRGEHVEFFIDDFRLRQVYNCQSAFDQQKKLASTLSHHYDLPVYIGTELSVSSLHMTAFGSWVPILDCDRGDYSEAEAAAHVKSYMGALSLNHPFSKWKRQDLSRGEREKIIRNVFNTYKENRCYGADLIEIGFPEGRHGFSLRDYLKLWDLLSSEGLVITGIGVSDAHNNLNGWESGNNFVNWIRSKTIAEKNLVSGMQSGDLYMGDPTLFHGELEFTTIKGHRMGQIVVGGECSEVRLWMAGCKPGWEAHWIVNGVHEKIIDVCDEELEFYGKVRSHREFNFTRFEVYSEDGRCILLTNPIYFARKMVAGFPRRRVAH